jgi:hypothetical protein
MAAGPGGFIIFIFFELDMPPMLSFLFSPPEWLPVFIPITLALVLLIFF